MVHQRKKVKAPIQREEMLAIYESPNNLPVSLFGKLAGKSKHQINRELKAGKLLSISLGNRGQRSIPEDVRLSVRRLVDSAVVLDGPKP